MDITPHIQSKSDQLNADDLISGDITVQVDTVTAGSDEQPVTVKLTGGHQPWKPCKTCLRCLSAAWGTDAGQWAGRWATLHRDDSVRFGGAAVGGIRVIAVSHIDAPITLSLALSRGKKSPHRIAVLQPADQEPSAPTADLDAVLKENDLTRDNLNQWLAEQGKPTLDTKPESAPAIAVWLAAKPANVAAVKGVTG